MFYLKEEDFNPYPSLLSKISSLSVEGGDHEIKHFRIDFNQLILKKKLKSYRKAAFNDDRSKKDKLKIKLENVKFGDGKLAMMLKNLNQLDPVKIESQSLMRAIIDS